MAPVEVRTRSALLQEARFTRRVRPISQPRLARCRTRLQRGSAGTRKDSEHSMSMTLTNQTNQDYWFGPLHLDGGVGTTLIVDDTSATSLYLTDDSVAD